MVNSLRSENYYVAMATGTGKNTPSSSSDVVVLFDLETTGLPRDSDICQIAAWAMGGGAVVKVSYPTKEH